MDDENQLDFSINSHPLLHASAIGHAQTINLNKKNVSIEEVFKALKQQTDYDFVYSKKQLEKTTRVNIAVKNATINEVLDQCFENQPLSYTIEDKTIIIKDNIGKTPLKESIRSGAINISGKVTDSLGRPLFGATVKILGKTNATRTDEKGNFSLISEQKSGTLVIAYIGYRTKEIPFSDTVEGQLTVIMFVNESDLNEVEVVSTGYQNIPKERATGSFTTINENTINRNVCVNILDRLDGVTNGLLLNRALPTQGDANNSKISIRGRSTIFANAEPLIVLDGLPYDGTIEQINPADIATINILKDAAAASIWGTRAGNGVIVLTSKKGSRNQKLIVQVFSTLTVTNRPDLYYLPQLSSSEYIDLEQYLFNKGAYDGDFNNAYSYVSPAVEIFNQRKNNLITIADSASRIEALISNDIRKDLEQYAYRPAVNQQYQLNLRGGGENNRYYMSGGYDKNLENSVSNDYDRLTLHANNTYSLFRDKLEITGGINFTSSNAKNASNTYLPSQPYDRLVDNNGNSLAVSNSSNFRQMYVDTAGNGKLLDWTYRPKDELNSNSYLKRIQYKINLGVDYKVFKDLHLNANYQYLNEDLTRTVNQNKNSFYTRNLINTYTSFVNGEVNRGIPLGEVLQKSESNFVSKIIRIQASYNKLILADHEITAIAGYEGGDFRNNGSGFTLYGFDPILQSNGNNLINPLFDYPRYYEPSITSRFSTTPSLDPISVGITQSYYANASYAYKGRYILSGSGRRDESNLFGVKTNQKGVPLWSAGLAWVIEKEPFYHISWLPSLKLRTTYGYSGNVDKAVSGYLTVFNYGLRNPWGNVYSEIANPPNPLLRWEKVKTWNFGLDLFLQK